MESVAFFDLVQTAILPLSPLIFAIIVGLVLWFAVGIATTFTNTIFGIAMSFGMMGSVFGVVFGMIDGTGIADALPALLAGLLVYLGATLQVPGKIETRTEEVTGNARNLLGIASDGDVKSRNEVRVERPSISIMSAIFTTDQAAQARTTQENERDTEQAASDASDRVYDKTRVFVAVVALSVCLLAGLSWGHTQARQGQQADRAAAAHAARLAADEAAARDAATAAQNAALAEAKAAADAQRALELLRVQKALEASPLPSPNDPATVTTGQD